MALQKKYSLFLSYTLEYLHMSEDDELGSDLMMDLRWESDADCKLITFPPHIHLSILGLGFAMWVFPLPQHQTIAPALNRCNRS